MKSSTALITLLFALLRNVAAFAGVCVVVRKQPGLTNTGLLLFKGKDYDRVVENIMATKNMSREEAEKDYDKFRENPNNYALEKGEEYYKSLGYKSFMDGVIGEAEKEGRGDEVRERLENFKRKSQIKAFSVLSVGLGTFFYWKMTNF